MEDFRIKSYRYLDTFVTIERTHDDKWIVRDGPFTWTTDGKWELEPIKSSRTEEFESRSRFTLDVAMDIARKIAH